MIYRVHLYEGAEYGPQGKYEANHPARAAHQFFEEHPEVKGPVHVHNERADLKPNERLVSTVVSRDHALSYVKP